MTIRPAWGTPATRGHYRAVMARRTLAALGLLAAAASGCGSPEPIAVEERPALACPEPPAGGRFGDRVVAPSADGASADALGAEDFLVKPATWGLVCAYAAPEDGPESAPELTDEKELTEEGAAAIRAAVDTGIERNAMVDCGAPATATSYVVALGDDTGTVRSLVTDGPGCDGVYLAEGPEGELTYAGLGYDLVQAIGRAVSEAR